MTAPDAGGSGAARLGSVSLAHRARTAIRMVGIGVAVASIPISLHTLLDTTRQTLVQPGPGLVDGVCICARDIGASIQPRTSPRGYQSAMVVHDCDDSAVTPRQQRQPVHLIVRPVPHRQRACMRLRQSAWRRPRYMIKTINVALSIDADVVRHRHRTWSTAHRWSGRRTPQRLSARRRASRLRTGPRPATCTRRTPTKR